MIKYIARAVPGVIAAAALVLMTTDRTICAIIGLGMLIAAIITGRYLTNKGLYKDLHE